MSDESKDTKQIHSEKRFFAQESFKSIIQLPTSDGRPPMPATLKTSSDVTLEPNQSNKKTSKSKSD